MKLLRSCALFICLTSSSYATAQENSFIAPLSKQSVLLDAYVSDFMVVVGERGHVLLSQDGESFKQVQVPTQSSLTSVSVVGDKIWAAGHDAIIIHSADRGETWDIQYFEPDLERPFLDILFFNENEGIAIGAYGLFYRTLDGGSTWVTERHAELLDPMDQEYLNEIRLESEDFFIQELDSILPHLNRVSVSGDKLFMAGETGLLAMSENSGKSWQRLSVDYFGSFFDIKNINPDSTALIAVGLRGNAFLSEDGTEWSPIQTCTSATLNTLYQTDDDKWIAVGNNGVITQFSLPLEAALYASESECNSLNDVRTIQTKEKSALVSVVSINDKLLAVSAEGIQPLNLQ